MQPCNEHGERIAALEAKVNSMEDAQKERHTENSRKLDDILHEVRETKTEARRTNGRVTVLETEAVHGRRRVNQFVAPAVSGLIVGLALMIVKVIWHV